MNAQIRQMKIWKQLWLSQDGECSECGKAVTLSKTRKRSYSFEILCKTCYENPQCDFVIYDEASEISEDQWSNLAQSQFDFAEDERLDKVLGVDKYFQAMEDGSPFRQADK